MRSTTAMATMGSATRAITSTQRRSTSSMPFLSFAAAMRLIFENITVVSGTISTPSRNVISR